MTGPDGAAVHAKPAGWRRPTLRTDEDEGRERSVSWLELFVDLAFVVVVSRVAEHLAVHLAPGTLLGFAVQFLAVFWVWNAFTYYTERFESAGPDHRLLGFAAVVAVAGLAVFGGDGVLGADSGFTGFALAYLLARVLNIACWLRAGVHVRVFRPVAGHFAVGFAGAAILVVAGLVVGPPWGVALFAAAVLLEIATPSATIRRQATLPALSTSRFPERFGQFTIIVLGEGVLEIITALGHLSEHHQLDPRAGVLGLLGLGVTFALCSIYFDLIARRPARRAFLAGLLWVYLHMSVLLGITLTGIGVALVVDEAPTGELTGIPRALLVVGVVVSLLAVAALQPTLARSDADTPSTTRRTSALCGATAIALLVVGAVSSGALGLLAILLLGLAVPVAYGSRRVFTAAEP